MLGPVIRKLETFGPIAEQDRDRLCKLIAASMKTVSEKTDLTREGDSSRHIHLLISGFACRYKTLKDGRRQIVAFVVPGDVCDAHTSIVSALDHSVGTLAPSCIATIAKEHISELFDTTLAEPMLKIALVDEAILREWVLNLGKRRAETRTAHLICELHARFERIGLAGNDQFELPLTQADWADALGLSLVHMNRSLKGLRTKQLITFRNKKLTILDAQALHTMCGFEPNYLHLSAQSIAPEPFSGASYQPPISAPH